MTEYCQTCGGDPAACRHGRTGSLLLESLGFAEPRTQRRALRVTPPPAPAPPVLTTVATDTPTRSTTGLVAELWEAEPELPPFPPAEETASIDRPSLGWARLVAGLLMASALGVVAYVGGTAWLHETSQAEQARTAGALTSLQAAATGISGAPALIADPTSDVIVLGAISTTIADLQAAADQVGAAIVDLPTPLESIGIELGDPDAGRQAALGQVLPGAHESIDRLTTMLSTRLALEQLAVLPELPSGTDNATTDQLSEELIGIVTDLRATSARLPDELGNAVADVAGEFETTTIEYLTALRSHDPAAEDLAVDVARIDATAHRTIIRWLEAESAALSGQVDAFVGSVASIR